MNRIIDKFFTRTKNLNYIVQGFKDLSNHTPIKKIFASINKFSSNSEIRYVGGCVRKIIIKENVDDIDLATNLNPQQVCKALKNNNISFYETGIEHGTITAVIDNYRFEITSLREDIETDGRHAEVKFSSDWKKDASRRDFTINSIYSDIDGNLFDPFNGKKDLEIGAVKFIGSPEQRIKEDYLRILRYLRFFLNYSKNKHEPQTLKAIKKNLDGVSNLSKERLLDELRKIAKLDTIEKLSKDKMSLDLISMIFPELKNIKIFSKLDSSKKDKLKKMDFIFLLSLMIVDDTDNTDYFIYKFNISKKDQKRIKTIYNFYKEKINSKTFTKKNINKVFYFNGKQAALDILNFRIIKSKKVDKAMLELINHYEKKKVPLMPIGADELMEKYKIPEGKQLGVKLKMIEEEWVKNNFQISIQQVDRIIKN